MDINFDLHAVISFLKRGKMVLLPICIGLGAIVFLLPTIMFGNGLKKDMEVSNQQGKRLTTMINSKASFSNQQEQIAKGYSERHQQDADEVMALAKQTTQRELISYGVFPEPQSKSQTIYTNFAKDYRKAIEGLVETIGARDAPSPIEKQNATSHLRASSTSLRSSSRPIYGGRTTKSVSDIDPVEAVTKALCEKLAGQIPVYANTSILKWYDFWDIDGYKFEGKDRATRDCWDSQVAFWVYEDVVNTIKNCNVNSTTVKNSPVKRLLEVALSIKDQGNKSSQYGRSSYPVARQKIYTGIRDVPSYVTERMSGSIVKEHWTQRECDGKIDVIQFSTSLIVDVSAVPDFMKELLSEKTHKYREGYKADGKEMAFKHNQITILGYSTEAIQRDLPEHADYRYGDGAVVKIELDCEYIFYKSGYDEIMPKSVKKEIEPRADAVGI